jgi:hypothetical protein
MYKNLSFRLQSRRYHIRQHFSENKLAPSCHLYLVLPSFLQIFSVDILCAAFTIRGWTFNNRSIVKKKSATISVLFISERESVGRAFIK